MKAKRNDPCPCGSGKKYKKCCLAQDQAGAATFVPPPRAKSMTPDDAGLTEAGEPLRGSQLADPVAQQQQECWKQFESADYEQRVAIFTRDMEEPWMSGDLALDMAHKLFDDCFEHGERGRFDQLMAMLKQKRPADYAKDAVAYLSMQINNALVAGGTESLGVLVHELGVVGETHIDRFNFTLSQLAYHGRLDLLLDARRTAWPHIRESKNVVPWGIEEFGRRGIYAELFDWLEGHPAADAQDASEAELLRRTSLYGELDQQTIGDALARMSGRKTTVWSLADFELDRPGAVKRRTWDDDDEDKADPRGSANLADLTYEFLGYARREAGIPWPRAELGRNHLMHYMLDRHAGRLEESMAEAMMRIAKGKMRVRPRRPENVLCPDPRSLDAYLARLLSPLKAAPVDAAALLMLVPVWLRFVESRGLIDAARRRSTLQAIAYLADSLAKTFEQWGEDPSLAADMRRWREAI